MIRDVRKVDSPYFVDLMDRGFPEESALLGNRPEDIRRIVRSVFRWDRRLVLGLLRAFGRPVFRLRVVEADHHLVAMTMVTFPRTSAYVSNVVVDPAYRRRGYAKQLLEEARRIAKGAGRRYVVLDVLENNHPARTLYESLGYRPLRTKTHYVLAPTGSFGAVPPSTPAIRPFRPPDATALVEIVRRQTSRAIEAVTPTSESRFLVSRFLNRILESEEAAWVVDRGSGAEAHVAATVSAGFDAANMSTPVVAESVETELAGALVRTAGAWVAERKAPRILSIVADDNARGRAALEAVGFNRVLASSTLYRPVG